MTTVALKGTTYTVDYSAASDGDALRTICALHGKRGALIHVVEYKANGRLAAFGFCSAASRITHNDLVSALNR